MSDFPNHSMNSLRSDSISYNPRLNIDSENPTYSKDLLVRNVFENLFEETWSTVRLRALLASLVEECFREFIRGNMEHRAVTCSARFACRRMFSRICLRQPIKNHPDPLMGRGYLNVRATGGAVKSLPKIGEDLGVV